MNAVQLVGLDFGTTTSSAVVALAELLQNSVTGRMELGHVQERFRSPLIFTPWRGERLDVEAIEGAVKGWLQAGGVERAELFGGGALLTGLTAQAENAALLVDIVRRYLGDAFVATADDPCLESWLAFHGSCAALSRAQPHTPILNLDIGGGTTNAALGLAGDVLATGCLFVGARHVQVRPGTYEIVRLSSYARTLFEHLGIAKSSGAILTDREVAAILDMQMRWLEALATGQREPFAEPLAWIAHGRRAGFPTRQMDGFCEDGRVGKPALQSCAQSRLGKLHEQAPLRWPAGLPPPVVTISGGVGELVYARLRGEPWPTTTAFSDLGIDLAKCLFEASPWTEHFRTHVPASCGRATVYGLLRHSTQVSGSTVFLTESAHLPLSDLPILGRIGPASTDEHLQSLLEMAQRSKRGAALGVDLGEVNADSLRQFAERLARRLETLRFSSSQPLVLFTTQNVGKILGQLITRWGRLPLRLLVVDEVDIRNAQYAHLGAARAQVIPVSVFGLNE